LKTMITGAEDVGQRDVVQGMHRVRRIYMLASDTAKTYHHWRDPGPGLRTEFPLIHASFVYAQKQLTFANAEPNLHSLAGWSRVLGDDVVQSSY
jgi:hypothetical protein